MFEKLLRKSYEYGPGIDLVVDDDLGADLWAYEPEYAVNFVHWFGACSLSDEIEELEVIVV